ncbi:DNA or RNA helicases of superfamily II [Pyrobaculum oguniense TE7]|uniref:DNA or RNA helicases of superfamily II n=1 Tax=Pyrobaculum oguniense (strain DSM 13380 / JCM 10595 / TE7) TaxID=698757 RepID=H6Q611_PYROT|nr:DNA or RNA helicases of superfamily II [Pyrobaculum oguniense TE7]
MVSLVEFLRSAGKELYKHQLDFVSDALLMAKPRVLLADDVGLGKTIQALLLVKALMEAGRVNHVLIVVPRAVFGQWAEELEKFGISYYAVESPSFPYGHRLYLITLDRAKMREYLDALLKLKWDLVVVDEAHKLRLDTQRARVAQLCKEAEGCLMLTATPHTGDEEDFKFLTSLVGGVVVRREKKDVEMYEGRKLFPRIRYWVVQVRASREEALALYTVLSILERENIEPIVRVVVEKRAMSSPASFFKTLAKVVGGDCTREMLEEGELDACVGNIAGLKDLQDAAKRFASASDKKLAALKRLLEQLKGRKVLVFTEYATTAEYLFENLAGGCAVVDSGEGFAKASCGSVGVMYATSKARGQIDVGVETASLARAFETAVFISTDIMSEGVNLQDFDVVVNYEVVWSPTKHVQRIGRIWRFGQKSDPILVIDMVLKAASERDEYSYYVELLEKLYEISLRALPPQSYGEFEIYEIEEAELRKVLEIGSAGYVEQAEVLQAVAGRRVEELREKIRRILEEREKLKWKPKSLVENGLRIKLGYPPAGVPEAGGGYYVVEVRHMSGGVALFGERLLIRLHTPLSRSRQIQEALFRESEVDWDGVQVEAGEVKSDERDELLKRVHLEVFTPLRRYVDELKKFIPLRLVESQVISVARARVIRGEATPLTSFEGLVWSEVRRSVNIHRTELAAVKCVEKWLLQNGFKIREQYRSVPRPFDMVVERGGVLYTVEIKGKWAGKMDDPISFTANEVDWASRFPDRHIICVAYVEGDDCISLDCLPFAEFQKKWIFETVRGLEYKYNARRVTG